MKLDDIKKLHQKKYRQQFGCCLVEGEHLLQELEQAARLRPALAASEIFHTDHYHDWPSALKKTLVSERHMAQMTDTRTPQGILAVVPLGALQPPGSATAGEKAIYLHEIQDPGNLGTILRSLAWFGGFRCLLSPGSVDPFNPKVIRASMGAIFHVPMELDVSMESLRDRFSSLACLDMRGEALTHPDFSRHDCYLFGNEARGLPDTGAQAFTIPGSGAIESLNLASAVNLCVYEIRRISLT